MCDLIQPHFVDKDKAREYLENLHWQRLPDHRQERPSWAV
jgi:hypothetical protein